MYGNWKKEERNISAGTFKRERGRGINIFNENSNGFWWDPPWELPW